MQKGYYGLATGIGSFPYRTPQEALDIIFSRVPEIPHWPQLPKAGNQEGLVRQYLSLLLQHEIVLSKEGQAPCFVTGAKDWERHAAEFTAEFLDHQTEKTINAFALPPEDASGFYAFAEALIEKGQGCTRYIKGQVTGPLTCGIVITDEKMQPSFYRDELRHIITYSLSSQVRWQIRYLQQFGRPVIIFIDEPGLYAFGHKSFADLSRTNISQSLQTLIEAAHEEGAEIGIHTCAGTDWSLLFELPFDLINIDIYNYFSSLLQYTDDLNKFLARGGALAWGIVPTSQEIEQETAERLYERMLKYLKQLTACDVDENRVRRQLLFTPSCGTGTLTDTQVKKVYRLLQEICSIYAQRF